MMSKTSWFRNFSRILPAKLSHYHSPWDCKVQSSRLSRHWFQPSFIVRPGEYPNGKVSPDFYVFRYSMKRVLFSIGVFVGRPKFSLEPIADFTSIKVGPCFPLIFRNTSSNSVRLFCTVCTSISTSQCYLIKINAFCNCRIPSYGIMCSIIDDYMDKIAG